MLHSTLDCRDSRRFPFRNLQFFEEIANPSVPVLTGTDKTSLYKINCVPVISFMGVDPCGDGQ